MTSCATAQVIEAELGVRANKTFSAMAPGDVLATYADVAHAHARLGYMPRTTIEVGMRRFVHWYRSPQFDPAFAESGAWKTRAPLDMQPQ